MRKFIKPTAPENFKNYVSAEEAYDLYQYHYSMYGAREVFDHAVKMERDKNGSIRAGDYARTFSGDELFAAIEAVHAAGRTAGIRQERERRRTKKSPCKRGNALMQGQAN